MKWTHRQIIALAFSTALVALAPAPQSSESTAHDPRPQSSEPPASDPPENAAEGFERLATEYEQTVRPLVARFCLDCHASVAQEGDLDLEQFADFDDVRQGTKVWQQVVEMLDSGEMPPDDAPQPSAAERAQLGDWVKRYLHAEALAQAGDPGPVVLRRLNNAEYTYTIRDLTGVPLDPAREFPGDSASGEGFTNSGNSLVMSPAMLSKYLDAGKSLAAHAVLLPDGFRFSPSTTRRDWTDEILADIREFYGQFTESGGAETVTQQGIELDKNKGGVLPLRRYLLAALECRQEPQRAAETARREGLSPKYLALLLRALNDPTPSPVMDRLRSTWREATPDDVEALAGEIGRWQGALWRFSSVGHIGKVDGPKAWMEPVTPLVERHELRLNIPAEAASSDVVLYFVVGDAGDGSAADVAVWHQPRLELPDRAPILLRDLRETVGRLEAARERVLASTARCLAAADEAAAMQGDLDLTVLARRHEVEVDVLRAWLDYLGIAASSDVELNHLEHPIREVAGYDFVQGWGSPDLPSLVANASDQQVRIPGQMKPQGVAVHPSPTLNVAVGWRSPVQGAIRIEGGVTDAHPECGNGVTWSLEWRRGKVRRVLAEGTTRGGAKSACGPIDELAVGPGDLVSLVIGPRDGDHTCDLTDLELNISTDGESWSLADEVAGDVLAGNPRADRQGRPGVWHFYSEPVEAARSASSTAAGSLLAQWHAAQEASQKRRLAEAIQSMLLLSEPGDLAEADAALYRQLTSLKGPLVAGAVADASPDDADAESSAWGLEERRFGRHPDGTPIDPASLCVHAPSVVEVRLPGELAAGGELVATGMLHEGNSGEGSVQFRITPTQPEPPVGMLVSGTTIGTAGGTWSSNNQTVSFSTPVVVADDSPARARFERYYDEFRRLFPAALCYTKIVPVDEVVTLTLYHREDEHLARLILDEEQRAQLDGMWQELRFVSHDALQLVDAFEQLWQYATQDADPAAFEPLRQPIFDRAEAFRLKLAAAEPKQIEALVAFAERAYRRPLEASEAEGLRALYHSLREQELSHDEAFRFTLAKIFVAPAFLYRLEQPPEGSAPGPVSDWELASRLSYFLWSSQPDDALRAAARTGRLRDPDVLEAEARRMLADGRIRRLATEFACQWLQIYEFDALDEKSERLFPEFANLRGLMYEEAIQFFTDLFQQDASLLNMLDADHTFVNETLASFYEIDGVAGERWQRTDGLKQRGRGGLLGFSATLAKQSGASRTSPILRGTWICEVLLGEKLPKPPPNVPVLPDDESATEDLTVRELVARHTSDPSCASCHRRIDPYGFSLEAFDAIGRRRQVDRGGRPVDTKTTLPDGTEVDDLAGLRSYLLHERRDAFVRQFCRKLLGYALGRGVQLSDEPLLDEMQQRLAEHDYRFSVAIDSILHSRQFREIRGRDADAGPYSAPDG